MRSKKSGPVAIQAMLERSWIDSELRTRDEGIAPEHCQRTA